MGTNLPDLIDAYLEHVRPYLKGAEVETDPVGMPNVAGSRFKVHLRPRSGREARFRPDVRSSHLSPATVAAIVARASKGKGKGTPWLVLAPHVSTEMGAELREHQVPYIDRAGNSHIELEPGTIIHIEGRRPPARDDVPRALRAESVRVIFGILARPDLVEAPVRETAQLVGVSKSTIANVLAELGRRGFIGKSRTRRQPLGATKLLDLWTAGYASTLRPRLVVGRFRSALRTPDEVEAAIGNGPFEQPWGWGGGSAALRLARHYRSEEVTLHVTGPTKDILHAARAVPARDGSLWILKGIGPLSYEGAVPGTVHPLLVHAELLASHDPRAHEAAASIYETHIAPSLDAWTS